MTRIIDHVVTSAQAGSSLGSFEFKEPENLFVLAADPEHLRKVRLLRRLGLRSQPVPAQAQDLHSAGPAAGWLSELQGRRPAVPRPGVSRASRRSSEPRQLRGTGRAGQPGRPRIARHPVSPELPEAARPSHHRRAARVLFEQVLPRYPQPHQRSRLPAATKSTTSPSAGSRPTATKTPLKTSGS